MFLIKQDLCTKYSNVKFSLPFASLDIRCEYVIYCSKKRFTDVHSPSWILHISDSLGTPTSKQYTNVKERSLQSGVNLVPSFTCVRTHSCIFGRGKARKGEERPGTRVLLEDNRYI